jgi:hypothetical protein
MMERITTDPVSRLISKQPDVVVEAKKLWCPQQIPVGQPDIKRADRWQKIKQRKSDQSRSDKKPTANPSRSVKRLGEREPLTTGAG